MRPQYKILLLFALPSSAVAQGGPPLLTDDPGTPGDGHYEINTAVTARYRKDQQEYAAPLIDLNFGITERGQLKIEVPQAFIHADGSHAKSGLGEITVGFKWRFIDQDANNPMSVSIYPQFTFAPSSRSKALGLAEHGVGALLPIEVSIDFGQFSAGAEVGHVLRTQNPDETLYGAVLGWRVSNKTEWLVEYHHISSKDPGVRESLINFGLRQMVNSRVNLLTAIGSSPDGARDHVHLNAYIGLQITN